MMPNPPISENALYVHDAGITGRARWLAFSDPVEICVAHATAAVGAALRRVEEALRDGWYVAGFLSYEAACFFDTALAAHAPGALPLLWFGIYTAPREVPPPSATGSYSVSPWRPDISETDYRAAIGRIKELIAAGDTYQVNYTYRLRADFTGDPWAFFAAIRRAQTADYSAYVNIGSHILCSASPELFFQRRGRVLTCLPMKGTTARGLTTSDDDARAAWLHTSEKNRAENVMIVDMIRNDLGRIAAPGDVRVNSLYDVERYETLWQMTSTVSAESDASLTDTLAALFPCASITGAPKIRTSQIIRELEPSPRGVYTGAIGFLTPEGDAQFSVAIRTATLDVGAGRLEYGTGGGITWDSTAADEYAECKMKARVLTTTRPEFSLLETILWRPGHGFLFLDRHLCRLADTARYFGYPVNTQAIMERLEAQARGFTTRQRVRLLVARDGAVSIEHAAIAPRCHRWRVALAAAPVDAADCFLYHKTTNRAQYTAARDAAPGYDDVILWNHTGEITESTLANVVIRRRGRLLTPPVANGLLAGVCRAHLLATARIEEAIIPVEWLHDAEDIYLINSVRGWIPTHFFKP